MDGMAQQMMNQQANQNQNTNQGQNPPVEKPQTKEDIMDTLKQLGELKESGILTQEEFDAKKTELLSRL